MGNPTGNADKKSSKTGQNNKTKTMLEYVETERKRQHKKKTVQLEEINQKVDASIQRLEDYIEKQGGLIAAIKNDTVNMMTTRKQKWEEKQLYGCVKQLINNISHKKTWNWLRKGNFKRETKSLLIAA